MLIRPKRFARRGAAAVEFAVIAPVTFLLILGLIIGGLGVFRYQQVASLAREGARWASVHGGSYQLETGRPSATAQDVYDHAIAPNAVALDSSRLSYAVSWDNQNKAPLYYDTGSSRYRINRVRVTVTYSWIPEAYLGGITLTSTSEVPLTY